MKKIIIFLALLYSTFSLHAATLTDPVVNLGTIAYSTSTPGVWVFASNNLAQGGITKSSGADAAWSGESYTPFNATNLLNRGHAKYAHIKQTTQNPPEVDDPNCGKLTVTDIKVYTSSGQYLYRAFPKSGGNPVTITGYANGIYFPFVATVTPYAGKGTCTITQTYTGWFCFAEGDSADPGDSAYTPFSITFSVTLVTPGGGVVLEHDDDASLNFGTLCRANQAQTLTITPAGTVEGPNVACPVSADITSDSFTVSSSSSTSFSVALPNTITLSSGNTDLSVTDTTSSCSGGCSVGAGDLPVLV